MKNKFNLLLLLVIISSNIFGQDKDQLIKGKVTFITSNNVYVKFSNTETINVGDTLQFAGNKSPCLVVVNKSSSSCVCAKISNSDIKKDDEVSFKYSPKKSEKNERSSDEQNLPNKEIIESENLKADNSKYKEYISGKISLSTYSTLSDTRDDRHRVMPSFSLNAEHIGNSRFSFETYLNYRQNILVGDSVVSQNLENLKVYDLALRFDVDSSMSIAFGRKINDKISSVGAIDGLQAEKYVGNNYFGLIAGFRPDIFNYGFNSNLYEYGVYYGRMTDMENFRSQTTIGVIEQRNRSEIDRRYTCLQHTSTVLKKIYVYSSVELDLYNKVNGVTSNDLRLTNLYISARYRFNRKLDLTLSYDSRKRVLYYETFQTEIEQLIAEEARQGLRARINYKPIRHLIGGFSYGRKFQLNNNNNSDNFYAYVSWSKIPFMEGGLSVSYNRNTSNYLGSNMFSVRHSRTLIDNKLYADFYYRYVEYNYLNNDGNQGQNYYGANLSYNFTRKLMLSVSGELSNFNKENNYRIYTKIIKRFSTKRK